MVEVEAIHRTQSFRRKLEYFKVADGWHYPSGHFSSSGEPVLVKNPRAVYVARLTTHEMIHRGEGHARIVRKSNKQVVETFLLKEDLKFFRAYGFLQDYSRIFFAAMTPKMIERLSRNSDLNHPKRVLPHCKRPFKMLKSRRAVVVNFGSQRVLRLDGSRICYLSPYFRFK